MFRHARNIIALCSLIGIVALAFACGRGGGGDSAGNDLEKYKFFAGSNGTDGYELWKSDGTEAHTVMVKDINPAAMPFV